MKIGNDLLQAYQKLAGAKRNSRTQGSISSKPEGTAIQKEASVEERIRKDLDGIKLSSGEGHLKARQILIRHILQDKLGEHILADPEFQSIVTAIEKDFKENSAFNQQVDDYIKSILS